jgi:site-specific recombinase XerD
MNGSTLASGKPMYDEMIDYLRHIRKTVSNATYQQVFSNLRALYRYCVDNNKTLDQLTQTDVETLLRSCTSANDTKKILCRVIKKLYEFLQWPENPARHVHLLRSSGRKLPHVPSEDQVRKAMQKVTGCSSLLELRNRALVELAYGSGLRIGELERLNIEDIDFNEHTVYIRGKGDKTRIVPLTSKAIESVQAYCAERRVHRGPLFVGRHYGRRLKVQMVGKIFRDKTGIRAHLYRHACATHMLKNGCDVRYIQQLLGHVDLTTTQFYTHIKTDELKAIISHVHPRAGGFLPE